MTSQPIPKLPPKKPRLEIQTTTHWDYPSQHYGEGHQGDPAYRGATPSYVIWNLLERYTRRGDMVIDPMCGSGTTIDVATELGRRARGFDLSPYRDDIEEADARNLPVGDESVDFVFVDPPYSDNLKYSDDPRCIGHLNATDEAYFEALDEVMRETFRILKNRRYFGYYVCDYYSRRKGFVPIGMRSMALMLQYFEVVDHICVQRHNRTLEIPRWRKAARDGNFFLRGFNHLIVAKKQLDEGVSAPEAKPRHPKRPSQRRQR